MNGHDTMVRLLVENGADVAEKNNQGGTKKFLADTEARKFGSGPLTNLIRRREAADRDLLTIR